MRRLLMQTVIVIGVIVSIRPPRPGCRPAHSLTPAALSRLRIDRRRAPASTPTAQAGDCPTTPVNVVVSVDQWGQIAIGARPEPAPRSPPSWSGSSVDPHDFEPSPSDAATFAGAQLVVINGGHYDEWAGQVRRELGARMRRWSTRWRSSKAITRATITMSRGTKNRPRRRPRSRADGVNPHAWYSPARGHRHRRAPSPPKLNELSAGRQGVLQCPAHRSSPRR